MGRVRATVSAGLALPEGLEPARSDLVSALVIKCGGADAGSSVARLRSDGVPGSSDAFPVRADAFRGSIAADALEIFEGYRCQPDVVEASRNIIDRADDLVDQALFTRDTARRNAEESVLYGSCTYAPAAGSL